MRTPPPENLKNGFKSAVGKHWDPNPIAPPAVDPELPKLGSLQRSAEVFRFSILSVEWWLSPNGTLREWCKLNGKISSILVVPAVLVIPVVTFILWQLAMWMGFLIAIAGNLIAALLALGVTAGAVGLIRAIMGK